jgi:hypothetical protein
MTSATSNDDGALVKTAAARVGFSSLPLDVISTHILRSDFLPEPGDLRSLRAVSKGMRDAVDATGREIKKLSNLEAAELGYLSLLKDRRTRGLPSYFWKEETRFFVLPDEWPREDWVDIDSRNRPWDEWPCAYAARGGHFEVLKWLRDNDCPWEELTCYAAARGGHLEVLRWLREHGCPWDEDTCAYAAYGSHLEVLQWAREHGCPWDWWTCAYAAYGGHLEVLQWARENGCPWD